MMATTKAEVDLKISQYLNSEITTYEISRKSFVKVLLAENLGFTRIKHLQNTERSALYNEPLRILSIFKEKLRKDEKVSTWQAFLIAEMKKHPLAEKFASETDQSEQVSSSVVIKSEKDEDKKVFVKNEPKEEKKVIVEPSSMVEIPSNVIKNEETVDPAEILKEINGEKKPTEVPQEILKENKEEIKPTEVPQEILPKSTKGKKRGRKPVVKPPKSPRKKFPKNTFRYDIESYVSENNKSKKLTIETIPDKICNFSFSLQSFGLTMSYEENTPLVPIIGMDIHKLLFWPGVGIRLSLPEIEIFRYCNANIDRVLVHPFAELEDDDLQPNPKDIYRFYANKTIQSLQPIDREIALSNITVESYLEFIAAAMKASNFSKQEELQVVIDTILQEFSKLNNYHLKTCFSYYCNTNQYYRDFEPKFTRPLKEDETEFVQREIFNPEIVFSITRCNFDAEKEVDLKPIGDYFKNIIYDKNPRETERFNNMLTKAYAVQCVDCTDQSKKFTGPIKIALLSEHLGKQPDKELTCVKCTYHNKIDKIAESRWCHECI